MRISSRAIIFKEDKILLMFRRRIKDGVINEYYVIPGGGQEEGELLADTVVRELKEEMSIDIKILGYLGSLSDNDKNIAHYYHCEITKGQPKLGGEELERMTENNYYEPKFLNLDEVKSLDINGKQYIYNALNKEYIKDAY